MKRLLVGAVAYDPKVVTIWEGLREHFADEGVPIDYALFSDYERQVEELLAERLDIAWNTPLAHVRVRQRSKGRSRSLGMRDTDRDFRSRVIVRSDVKIEALRDLAGRTLAVGSRDSTQARILPLYFLRKSGVDLGRVRILEFDSDLGKHGDTGASELEVLEALRTGLADAGCIGDPAWLRAECEQLRVLHTTPPFDHCMFDGGASLSNEAASAFTRALFSMRWEDPHHRRILEMEGLKEWVAPRESGYASLEEALSGPDVVDSSRAWGAERESGGAGWGEK